jgi:hypothetical protein
VLAKPHLQRHEVRQHDVLARAMARGGGVREPPSLRHLVQPEQMQERQVLRGGVFAPPKISQLGLRDKNE